MLQMKKRIQCPKLLPHLVIQHLHRFFFFIHTTVNLFLCRSLLSIGNGCKGLKVLTLSDCYFLSDKSLAAIARGCSELTLLEVNACHNIGTQGLEAIGRSCRSVPCSCNDTHQSIYLTDLAQQLILLCLKRMISQESVKSVVSTCVARAGDCWSLC